MSSEHSSQEEEGLPAYHKSPPKDSNYAVDVREGQELLSHNNPASTAQAQAALLQSQPLPESQPVAQSQASVRSRTRDDRLREDVEKGHTACYMCCGTCAISRHAYERISRDHRELITFVVGLFAIATTLILIVLCIGITRWLFWS